MKTSSLPTFYDSVVHALAGVTLPRRYALDARWERRARALPFSTVGMFEWRAEGDRPVDLLCAARATTGAWSSWWSRAMAPPWPMPIDGVHEAWLEQDADVETPTPPAGAPIPETAARLRAPGYFWGTDATSPDRGPQLDALLQQVGTAQPTLSGASDAARRWLAAGVDIVWLGVFPSRDTRDALRLNLARRDADNVEHVIRAAPRDAQDAMRHLVARVRALCTPTTTVAWCWDQHATHITRLTAELSIHADVVSRTARDEDIAALIQRVGENASWLADAHALHRAFSDLRWATIPPGPFAASLSADVLTADVDERPVVARRISHLKVELSPDDPSGPLLVKLYGVFSLPGSGMLRAPSCSDTTNDDAAARGQATSAPSRPPAVWPALREAAAAVPWPYTAHALRDAAPWWQDTPVRAIEDELRHRANMYIAGRSAGATHPRRSP